jgi:outer membrane protein assembly factor BamA
MKYSREQIEEAVVRKGYRYFESGDYNVNIIGVRNSDTKDVVTNRFDDTITVAYKIDGEWQYHEMDCTTDPGTHWVENIMRKEGVAILKEGQYPGSHKIRKHQGRYEALGQCKPVTVYRDDNRDDLYNLNNENTQTGLFGINIHRATKYAGKKSTQVDKWSAGCQVIAANDDWTKFMKIMRKARATWSNSFTYTLIESKDIAATWL